MTASLAARERARSWRVAPGCTLHWRFFEEEALLYAGGPGDTHLLTAFGVAVLQALEGGPASLDRLTGQVARALALDDASALVETVDKVLVSFASLGVVERVPA